MKKLSHLDQSGSPRMVNVSSKQKTRRRARASGIVRLAPETIEILRKSLNPKGNPMEIARIAGIMGAKRTAELIPLCHQLNPEHIDVSTRLTDAGVEITAEVTATSGTGVEMEALTAVTIAALTVYDMCKAVQKDIEISEIRLESKTGGKSDYRRR